MSPKWEEKKRPWVKHLYVRPHFTEQTGQRLTQENGMKSAVSLQGNCAAPLSQFRPSLGSPHKVNKMNATNVIPVSLK